MIIRSQDNRKITNFAQVSDLVITKNRAGQFEILAFAGSDSGYSAIATYSNEEKAIMVLDMIQNLYTYENERLCISGKVFQMPKDEEVDVKNK